MPYSNGVTPGGISNDEGISTAPNITDPAGPAFFVGTTNVTRWIQRKLSGEKYQLNWFLSWPNVEALCRGENGLARAYSSGWGALMFDATLRECLLNRDTHECESYPKDVAVTSGCPEFGAVVEIQPGDNATRGECPVVVPLESRVGNPCAVKVNETVINSISSQVSDLTAPKTTTTISSSTSKAGVGPAQTVQTTLAAACLFCGLAL